MFDPEKGLASPDAVRMRACEEWARGSRRAAFKTCVWKRDAWLSQQLRSLRSHALWFRRRSNAQSHAALASSRAATVDAAGGCGPAVPITLASRRGKRVQRRLRILAERADGVDRDAIRIVCEPGAP